MSNNADSSRFHLLDRAFREGDWTTLKSELGTEVGFPNVSPHRSISVCLVYAIYHSPLELVQNLLNEGANPDLHEGDGFPPLVAAFDSKAKTLDVLKLLLENGADTDQRDFNDYTPLHLAAIRGDLPAVELLLVHGADPNATTRIDDMETPLEAAEKAGHRPIADRLGPLTVRLDWEMAVKTGDIAELEAMLRAGQNIDAQDGHSQTALMRAAHAGQSISAEWLIDHGAKLNHTAKFGLSALMLAVISGHQTIARRLIDAGADRSLIGSGAPGFAGKTAADLAEARGDIELAEILRNLD